MSLKTETSPPRPVRLADYRPSAYLIDRVDLDVRLDRTATRVGCKLSLRPNPKADRNDGALILSGSHFKLISVALNGRLLTPGTFETTASALTLPHPPRVPFTLETVTEVDPSANTALQGLYLSKGVYCTQCEAEGFRRITYMLDRPDVLARYRVRLEAEATTAPVLLSNGNLIERGTRGGGSHYAVWDDPHPKPCYLFALVAGDLGSIASDFITMSGRRVDLRIYVEHGKEARAAWAMDALKRSMAWDEKRFGREYDLERFNIVAVSDFNMGAMENKGLNIFNDRLILASAETATDANFEAIESVVAHEYFHNWTGNRITCRDWFQLCLKEGLTVYRDQEFSADMREATVQRIADVRQLKATQFPEDAGPLAHPVRPSSYIEINNFYTATVYEKGAEVVRMLATLLGEKTFAAGLELYFERHDGEAATIEQFLACFEAASGRSLADVMGWYTQAGTPHLKIETTYDRKAGALDVTLTQSARNGSAKPRPRPIPVRLGLVGRDGRDLPLVADDNTLLRGDVIVLTGSTHTVRFTGLTERPVASLLRGFSAPVTLETNLTDRDLAFLAARDSDLFNRWQATQLLAMRTLRAIYDSLKAGGRSTRGAVLAKGLAASLTDPKLDPAFRAELLRLPTISDLMAEIATDVDPALAIAAHGQLTRRIGRGLGAELEQIYGRLKPRGPYTPDAKGAGRRALRNGALSILMARGEPADFQRVADHYVSATNMTDQAHALNLLAHLDTPGRIHALGHFLARWLDDDLVIDLWFAAQAQSQRAEAFEEIKGLVAHPLFKLTTPNKVRALIMTFAAANPRHFHRTDGQGYAFVAKQVVAIDAFNPQVASRLVTSFRSVGMLSAGLRRQAQGALKKLQASPGLSRDVGEMVSRLLGH